MDTKIRHRRLYAFYKSKVLNALMIVIELSLLLIPICQDLLLPVGCASVAFAMFIGYALWIWIRKPARVVINKWLSGIGMCFTLYFLCVVALKSDNQWWYVFAFVCGVVTLFITLVTDKDEVFEIS